MSIQIYDLMLDRNSEIDDKAHSKFQRIDKGSKM